MYYSGKLLNGKQFDKCLGGKPFLFTLGSGEVIKGWDVGVMKMSVGSRVKLHIPSAMGYGARGAGDVIPPNADLVFDVSFFFLSPQIPSKGNID